ncbi:MAG: 50S ribosomal protein L5, partial [Phycisphaerae bacterium]|nr:50S ribosomal protein L5 [Phycisphaerae bacterium]
MSEKEAKQNKPAKPEGAKSEKPAKTTGGGKPKGGKAAAEEVPAGPRVEPRLQTRYKKEVAP